MAFPLHSDLLDLSQQFKTLTANYCNTLEKINIQCSSLVSGPRLQKLAAGITRDMGEIMQLMALYEDQLPTIQTSSLIFEENSLVNFISMQQMTDLTENVNHGSVFTGGFYICYFCLHLLPIYIYIRSLHRPSFCLCVTKMSCALSQS